MHVLYLACPEIISPQVRKEVLFLMRERITTVAKGACLPSKYFLIV